mgnify:CR=1 FL=1
MLITYKNNYSFQEIDYFLENKVFKGYYYDKELENKIGKKSDPENNIIASGLEGDIEYTTQQIKEKEKSKEKLNQDNKLSEIAREIKNLYLLADPNYNITKVKDEIKNNITLENLDSNILNDEQLRINENRLRDESKEAIKLNFNFQQAQMSEILSQAKILVEEKLTPREEIEDELRKWLEAGLNFHSHTNEEQECKFCKGKVSKERITELLENLNDEKRQIHKNKIEKLINLIKDINNNLLDYPVYTHPADFRGRKVPDVLLSGHHANIEKWRHEKSLERTFRKRPDMIEKADLSKKDIEYIEKMKNE